MIIEPIACVTVCNYNNPDTNACLYYHGVDGPIVYFVCNHNLQWSFSWLRLYINRLAPNRTRFLLRKCRDFVSALYQQMVPYFRSNGLIELKEKTLMVPNFRSNGPITLIFEKNLPIIIMNHPSMFH